MALGSVFSTTVFTADPTSGHLGTAAQAGTTTTSDFITVQSLANFALMAGAITAAWDGAGSLTAVLHGRWFPFVLCAVFGLVSILTAKPATSADRVALGGLGAAFKTGVATTLTS